MSDGPLPDAAGHWRRLYARRHETGLYPLLLEYPDDSMTPTSGGHGADGDAAAYLRGRWTEGAWPPFDVWPGLAPPAAPVPDAVADACAAEEALAVARAGHARCLALTSVSRGADGHRATTDSRMCGTLHGCRTFDLSGQAVEAVAGIEPT